MFTEDQVKELMARARAAAEDADGKSYAAGPLSGLAICRSYEREFGLIAEAFESSSLDPNDEAVIALGWKLESLFDGIYQMQMLAKMQQMGLGDLGAIFGTGPDTSDDPITSDQVLKGVDDLFAGKTDSSAARRILGGPSAEEPKAEDDK